MVFFSVHGAPEEEREACSEETGEAGDERGCHCRGEGEAQEEA